MNAIRSAFGTRNTEAEKRNSPNPKKKKSPTTSRSTKVAKPVGSAAPPSGWSKPFTRNAKKPPPSGTVGSSSLSSAQRRTAPTSRNGTVTPNSKKNSSSPNDKTNSKSQRQSPAKSPTKKMPRRPSTGKYLMKDARSKASSPTPSPPKRATKSAVSKGYVSKGPTYSVGLKAEDLYKNVPKSKWILAELKFAGSFQYEAIGKQEVVKGQSIAQAVKTFKRCPEKYVAIMFQDGMEGWAVGQQTYTFIHRHETIGFQPQGVSNKGWMKILVHQYQHLPAFNENTLPKQYRDDYTDQMVHRKRKIHTKNNPPIMPGRGMGVGDTPLLKLIGDIDPSDIHQGSVGDCWLLSAISALAEFDGAIKKLFRKTKNLDRLPLETPNKYTVTLWDLANWEEVDIVMDERLAAHPDGSGKLLASKPSEDGELWVCYLEKAFAIHCGGWDKLTGGQCSHAWSIMVGCREQYTIRKTSKTGSKYGCYAKYDPHKGKWSKHFNSPHDNMSDMWQVPWPRVGGGGGSDIELTEDQVFEKMLTYDKHDFIVAAGTHGTSDKNLTGGMVDNHAYSVIEAHSFGSVKLFKVRNPWGKGEIENGEFDDDGPGWDRHPKIKAALKPVVADDGIFYLTQEEFFKLFDHIYISCQSMSEFLED